MKVVLNVLAGCLTAAYAALGGACPVAAAERAIAVNIGWQPGTYYAFYVAHDQKLFERNGLEPNFIKFTAGPPMFAAFESGSIDVSWGGAVPAIVGIAQGVPLRVIALESVTKNALVVKTDSAIKGISDLAGKKIGTVKGSGAYFAMVKLLHNAGLDGKYDFVDMQMPSLLPAFSQSNVDGIWVWEPWASRAATEGRKVADELDIFGGYAGAPVMARTGWLAEKPEAVRRFLAALHMAQASYRNDPSNAINAMSSELGIPQPMAAEIFNQDPKPTFERQVTSGDSYAIIGPDAAQVKYFQSVGDFFHDNGLIKNRPDMIEAFTAQPLADYMKSQTR